MFQANAFLSAGNNPGVLKNSTEHAETLLTALTELNCVIVLNLTCFNKNVNYRVYLLFYKLRTYLRT